MIFYKLKIVKRTEKKYEDLSSVEHIKDEQLKR